MEGIIALVGELRGLVPSLTPKEELWVKREIENARKSTNFTDYFFKLMAKPEFCTHYFKRDMTLIWNAAQLVLAVNEFGLERGEMALWAKLAVEMNERTKSLDWATPTLIRAKILQDKAKLKNGFMHTMHKEEGHLLNLSRAFGEISESIFAQIITPYLDSLVDEKKDVPAKPKK